MKCTNCDSERLEWQTDIHTPAGIVQGRLKSSDCTPTFVLGCVECSETIIVIHADYVAQWLTAQRKFEFEGAKLDFDARRFASRG